MKDMLKIRNFLLGILQNLLDNKSINSEDLLKFVYIVYQEKINPLESVELDSLILIILSLIDQNTRIITSDKIKLDKKAERDFFNQIPSSCLNNKTGKKEGNLIPLKYDSKFKTFYYSHDYKDKNNNKETKNLLKIFVSDYAKEKNERFK